MEKPHWKHRTSWHVGKAPDGMLCAKISPAWQMSSELLQGQVLHEAPGGWAALPGHQSQIGEWERHKVISFSLEIKRSILPSAGMCTYANKTMNDSGLHLYLGGKNAVTQMLGVNNKSLSMGDQQGHQRPSHSLCRTFQKGTGDTSSIGTFYLMAPVTSFTTRTLCLTSYLSNERTIQKMP